MIEIHTEGPHELSRYTLHLLKENFMTVLTREQLEQCQINLEYDMQRAFYGLRINQDHYITVDVPATWWQQLKQEKAPAWYLKRYPVKTKKVKHTLTVARTFELQNHPPLNQGFDFRQLNDEII